MTFTRKIWYSIIVGGSFLLNQIIVSILLNIYNKNNSFDMINGWSSFVLIVALITFVFSISFFVLLILHYRNDKILLIFAILLLSSYFSNMILTMIPVTNWRYDGLAQVFGTLSYILRYINIAVALGVLIAKRHKKIVPITLIVVATYTHFFASWFSNFTLYFFRPIYAGSTGYNVLSVYMPFNGFIRFLAMIIVVLQILTLHELDNDNTRKKDFNEELKERDFGQGDVMDVINTRINK